MTPFTLPTIDPPDAAAMDAARARWANRAKPPGSLGRIEALAIQLAGVTGTCPPRTPRTPAVALFAGDHGVVAAGASAWPPEITAAMVHTIAGGGAAINAFARTVGASVTVVDVGVSTPIGDVDGVRNARIRAGTGNIAAEPAMSVDEAAAAVDVGRTLAAELIADGADLLIGGEMGIGNTTPSAALIAAVCEADAVDTVGPGAGLPAAQLAHKAELVRCALARVDADATPLELLAQVGGLEIAALAGLYIGAADGRVPFVVDGVIALAALCIAERLAQGVAALAIAGHRSMEPAASIALAHFGLDPVLDLDLRLGEGTGACLAVPVLQAACAALADMADLPEG